MRACLVVSLLLSLITGVLYPACVTMIAAVLCPRAANGSVIVEGGRKVGSELIGQCFDRPEYMWGRLSAAAADCSSGSNFGPLHPSLLAAAQARVEALRRAEKDLALESAAPIPVDLVTASASGLDPHISLRYKHFIIVIYNIIK